MELIDVHSHISARQFDNDREGVVQHSLDSGLLMILDSGETLKENEKSLDISEKFAGVKSCAGFSPKNIKALDAKLVLSYIRANADKFVAIGEVGLDYWYIKEHADREKQKKIFVDFIELAVELDKPLVIHSRSAGKYAIDLLIANNATRVCMHAFDGSTKSAQAGVDAGFFFSIPPSVTHSEQKRKLVEKLPIENILLESDAPALGPEKGKKNTPKNIVISLEEIAKIKQLDKSEVARVTTENARNLFKL
jgi:TatD DNase family protein